MALRLHVPLALGAVLLAAACASEPRWEKAGATPERASADLKACEASAPYEPRRDVPAPRSKPGSNTIDFKTASDRAGDQFLRDQRHVSECMRAKGYRDSNS